MELEKICMHKGKGCTKEHECENGEYYENGEKIKCQREVYHEIELWRTDYMRNYD